jgi:hypothetical protein
MTSNYIAQLIDVFIYLGQFRGRPAHLQFSVRRKTHTALNPIEQQLHAYLLNRIAQNIRKIPDRQQDKRSHAEQQNQSTHSRLTSMCKLQTSEG